MFFFFCSLAVEILSTPSNTVSLELLLQITPVNDAPEISAPSYVIATEDTAYVLDRVISISDADYTYAPSTSSLFTVSVSCQNCSLYLSEDAAIIFLVDEYGEKVFKGTLYGINTALEKVTYVPKASFYGYDVLSLSVSDNGYTGSDFSNGNIVALSTIFDVAVYVHHATGKWAINGGRPWKVVSHSPLSMQEITITSVYQSASSRIGLRLQCLKCLWVSNHTSSEQLQDVVVLGVATNSLSLVGPASAINTILGKYISYTVSSFADSHDNATAAVWTIGNQDWLNDQLDQAPDALVFWPVLISGYALPASLNFPAVLELEEDNFECLHPVSLVFDPSILPYVCRLQVSYDDKYLLLFSQERKYSVSHLTSNCADVLANLQNLCVAGQADVNFINSPSPLHVNITLSLPMALNSVEEQVIVVPISVHIRPVDDIVTVMHLGSPLTSELLLAVNEDIKFNYFSISDPDSTEGGIEDLYELSIRCSFMSSNGSVQGCVRFLHFLSSSTISMASSWRDREIIQRGNLIAVNTTLASMIFVQQDHFSGDIWLSIDVSSVYNRTSKFSARVRLTVSAVDDPLSLAFSGFGGQAVATVLVHEQDTVQPFNLTVDYYDYPESVVSLCIALEDGFVFADALFDRTRNLVVNSTVASINALLPKLYFEAPLVSNDRSMIKFVTANVSVSDLKSRADVSVQFQVLPVNDPPSVALSTDIISITKNSPFSLGFIDIDDVDSINLTIVVSIVDIGGDLQYQFVNREYNIPSVFDSRPMMITGSSAHIRSVLKQSTLVATADSMSDYVATLLVQVIDGIHTVQVNASVSFIHVEEMGQINFSITSLNFFEDGYENFSLFNIYQVNNYSNVYELNFTLSLSSGCFQFNQLELSALYRFSVGQSCARINIATTQSYVNEVLKTLFVKLPKYFHGVLFAVFEMHAPQPRVLERSVVFTSVNNAPVATVHNSSSCLQGAPSCELAVTISDADALDAKCSSAPKSWEINGIKLYGRYLSINVSSNVVGTSFSLGDASACFSYGTPFPGIALLCHAAAVIGKPLFLYITSPRSLHGWNELTVTYSDNGLCSESLLNSVAIPQTLSYSLSIDHSNVAPLLAIMQTHVTCTEDSTTCYIPFLSVDDPDLKTFGDGIYISMNCTYGTLVLDSQIAASDNNFVVVNGNGTAFFTLHSASLELLLKYATQLRFQPENNFNGAWPAATLTGQRATKSISVEDLASISIVASDGHSDSNREVVFVSLSCINDAPFIAVPVAVNVSDSRKGVFGPLDAVVLDDADELFPSQGHPEVYTLLVTVSDNGAIGLNQHAIASGIVHSLVQVSSQKTLKLSGSLSDLRTAMEHLEYDGSQTTSLLSKMWLELCDNGQLEQNVSRLCSTTSAELYLHPGMSLGYAVLVNSSQELQMAGTDNIFRIPSAIFELTKTASSLLDEKSLLQLVVSSKQGAVTAIGSSPYYSDTSKTFILTIPGAYDDANALDRATILDSDRLPLFGALSGGRQVVQKIVVSVPWQYAVQRIDLYTMNLRHTTTFPSILESMVALTLYNTTFSLPWTWYPDEAVVDTLQNAAASLKETLLAMDHISRDIIIEAEYPNDTASNSLIGSFWVKFVGNAGPVPPLNVSLLDSDFLASTIVISSGSLPAEIQEVVISNYSNVESGEYQLLFTKMPGKNFFGSTGLTETVDITSAKIAVNATDDAIKTALHRLFDYLQWVDVASSIVTIAGDTQRIIRMSFQAVGSNMPSIEVIVAKSSTTPLPRWCSDCREISSPVLAINVRTVSDGVNKLGGFFSLRLSDFSGTSIDFKNVDVPVVSPTPELITMKLQELLSYEVDPYSSNKGTNIGEPVPLVRTELVECTHENSCSWLLYITYFTESAPLLATGAVESGVDVRVHVISSGRAAVYGDFTLLLRSTVSEHYSTSQRIPVDASATRIRDILLRSVSGFSSVVKNVDVAVEKRKSGTDSVFVISMSYQSSSTDVIDDLVKPSELQLPTLSLDSSNVAGLSGSLQIKEVHSHIFSSFSKYLLSVQYPAVSEVNEVQSIVCRSHFLSGRQAFLLSFRNESTLSLFTDSYVLPEALPLCSTVLTGAPCRGDGLTVFERLSSLSTIPHGSIDIVTSSSTGTICPSLSSIDETFVTNITFLDLRSYSDSIFSGSTAGDVPMIVVRSPSLNTSTLFIREVVIGSTRERSEIQHIKLSYSGSLAGFFTLGLGSKIFTVPVNASEQRVAVAVAALLSIPSETLRVQKDMRDSTAGLEYDGSITYTILFPLSLGPLQLLHVLDQCSFVTPTNESSSIFGSDFSSSVSCLTIADNHLFEIQRVIPGYASLRGFAGFRYLNPKTLQESEVMVDVGRMIISDDIQAAMSELTGAEVSVRHISTLDQSNTVLFIISFSSAVGSIAVESIKIEVEFPACAYDLNQDPNARLRDGDLIIQTPQNACSFPFSFDGRPYSSCVRSSESHDTRGMCMNYVTRTSALCHPCVRSESEVPQYSFRLDLAPLRSGRARFLGNLEQLQHLLQNLVYYFDASALGIDQVQSFVFGRTSSDSLSVTVLPVRNEDQAVFNLIDFPGGEVNVKIAPTVSLPAISTELEPTVYVLEDEYVRLPKLFINDDVHVGNLERLTYYSLIISVQRGKLFSLSPFSPLVPLQSLRDGRELTLTGNVVDINGILHQLAYQPDPDFNSAQFSNGSASLAIQQIQLMLFVKNNSALTSSDAHLVTERASFKLGYAGTYSMPLSLYSSDEDISGALNALYGEDLTASCIQVVVDRSHSELFYSLRIDVFIDMNTNFASSPFRLRLSHSLPYGNYLQKFTIEANCDDATSVCAHSVDIVKNASIIADSLTVSLNGYLNSSLIASLILPVFVLPTFDPPMAHFTQDESLSCRSVGSCVLNLVEDDHYVFNNSVYTSVDGKSMNEIEKVTLTLSSPYATLNLSPDVVLDDLLAMRICSGSTFSYGSFSMLPLCLEKAKADDNKLVLTGSLGVINAAIRYMSYAPLSNIYGSTYIYLLICYNDQCRKQQILVDIDNAIDQPKIEALDSIMVSASSKSPLSVYIRIDDPDIDSKVRRVNSTTIGPDNNAVISVGLGASNGLLLVPRLVETGVLEYQVAAYKQYDSVVLNGTISMINIILAQVKYTHTDMSEGVIDIRYRSAFGSLSKTLVVQLAPESMLRATLELNYDIVALQEDTALSLADIVNVSFSGKTWDSSASFSMLLSADVGSFQYTDSLLDASRVQLVSTGNVLRFVSNSSSTVQAVLKSISFVPFSDYSGGAQISLTLMTHKIASATFTDSKVITVLVEPDDDLPVITVNASYKSDLYQLKGSYVTSKISLSRIFLVEELDDTFPLYLTAHSTEGSLMFDYAQMARDVTIPQIFQTRLSERTTADGRSIFFYAYKEDINRALEYLFFQPPTVFKGDVELSFSVSSQSSSMEGIYENLATVNSSINLHVYTNVQYSWNCVNKAVVLESNSIHQSSVPLSSLCNVTSSHGSAANIFNFNIDDFSLAEITVEAAAGGYFVLNNSESNNLFGQINVVDVIQLDGHADTNAMVSAPMKQMRFQVNLTAVNSILRYFVYQPFNNTNGQTFLSLSVLYFNSYEHAFFSEDATPLLSEVSLEIDIVAVNTLPIFNNTRGVSSITLSMEDTAYLDFVFVADIDSDEASVDGTVGYIDLHISSLFGSVFVFPSFLSHSSMHASVIIVDDGHISGQVSISGPGWALQSFIADHFIRYKLDDSSYTNGPSNLFDTITWRAWDNGFTGLSLTNASYSIFSLVIENVYVPEPIRLLYDFSKDIIMAEDTPIAFFKNVGISASSYDKEEMLVLYLSKMYGTYSYDVKSVSEDDTIEIVDGTDVLVIQGSVKALQKKLAEIIFVPLTNLNNFFVLWVELEHFNATSHDVISKESYAFKSFIYPSNDIPVMYVTPSSVIAYQSQKVVFKRDLLFVLHDVDNDGTSLYSLTVSAPCGMLALEASSDLADMFIRLNSSDQLITFSSPVSLLANKCVMKESRITNSVVEGYHKIHVASTGLDAIYTILQSLVYTAPYDFIGQTDILMLLQDAELNVSVSLDVTIMAEQAFPDIFIRDGTERIIQGSVLQLGTIDTGIKENSYANRPDPLELIIWVDSNLLAGDVLYPILIELPLKFTMYGFDLAIDYPDFSGTYSPGSALGLRGSVNDLKDLIPLVALIPAVHFSGRVTVYFRLRSLINGQESQTSIDVFVEPVNHQPVLTYDMAAIMIEDVPSDLSIRVHDVDIDFLMTSLSPLYTQHAASCCHISLSLYSYDFTANEISDYDTAALMSYNGSFYTSIALSGTPEQINNQLSVLQVVGNLDFYGNTSLFYSLSEGVSTYWASNSLPLIGQIPVTVKAVNDKPVLYSVANKSSFVAMDSLNVQRLVFNLTHNYSMRLTGKATDRLKSISSNKLFYSLEEDGVLAFGTDILLFDVDSPYNELIHFDVHSSIGVVTVPGGKSNSYSQVTSETTSGNTLNITAEYGTINTIIDSLTYVAPKYYTGYAYISISICEATSDEKNLYMISVFINDVNHPPGIVVEYNLTAIEDSIATVDSVHIVDGDNATTQGLYEAEVFASYRNELEVVNISVMALSVPNIQLITLLPLTSNHTTVLNIVKSQLTYKLALDLTAFGYGRVVTKPIYLNAVGSYDAEVQGTQYRGHDTYQSMQYTLQSLFAINLLNITVEVESLDTYFNNNSPQLENIVYVHGNPNVLNFNNTNSKGGNMKNADVANKLTPRQFNIVKSYRVVFHNAPRNFPTIEVLFNTSASISVTSKCVHPGNFVDGSFHVIFNNASTAALSYDVSEEVMIQLLEALPNVEAVGVKRTYVNKYINVFDNNIGVYYNNYVNSYGKHYNYTFVNNNVMEYLTDTNALSGVYRGFMWSITFFVVNNNGTPNNNRDSTTQLGVSKVASTFQNFISVNTTNLRGIFTYVTPDGVVDFEPLVQVSQIQPQVGQAEVYVLKERCQFISTIIAVNYVYNRSVAAGSQANMYQDSFYLNVTEPKTGAWELMGPIFPFTNDKEYVNKNPLNQDLFARVFGVDTDQYRLEGEAEGQSMESLFRSLPFFSLYTEDLQVTKTFIDSGRSILISWKVVFVNNDYRPLTFKLVPFNLSPVTNVTVSTLQVSNNIGGSFRMLNRNSKKVTGNIPYDVSAENLELVLKRDLGLQYVVVSRKGPDITGCYTYYVAITYNDNINAILECLDIVNVYNDSNRNVNNSTQGLTGYGASISSQRISVINSNYGVRLTGYNGVSNVLSSQLYHWRRYLSFKGSLAHVNAALKTLEVQPAPDFFGVIDLIIHVKDNIYSDSTNSQRVSMQDQRTVSVLFSPVNDAPVISFDDRVLSYDYTGTYSSDKNNVFTWDNRRGVDSEVVVHIQTYEGQLTPLGGEMLFLSNYDSGTENILTYTSSSHSALVNSGATLIGTASYTEPRRIISALGVHITDIDSAFITVTLEVLHGRLSIDNNILPYGESSPINFHNNRSITTLYSVGITGRNITIAGGLFEVNKLLMTLSYMPPIQTSGYDILTVRASDKDEMDPSSRGKLVQAHIVLNVSPVNDPPTISFALPLGYIADDGSKTYNFYHPFAILNVTEDTASAVGQYITIYDADFNTSNIVGSLSKYPGIVNPYADQNLETLHIFVLLKVERGQLTGNFAGSIRFVNISLEHSSPPQLVEELSDSALLSYSQYRAHHPLTYAKILCFTGTYSDVRVSIASLQYLPDADYFGADIMSIYVNDIGNVGIGGSKDVSSRILINIESVADRPSIILPAGQSSTLIYVYEDAIGIIGSDQYIDSVASPTSSASETVVLNLYSDVAVFNMTRGSIYVVDRDDTVYFATERVVVRDTTNYSNILTNDPLFNETYTSATHFDVYRFLHNDGQEPDDSNSHIYTLDVSVRHGRLSFNRVPSDIVFVLGSGFEDDHVIVKGKLSSVNILLSMLFYKADPNFNANTNNLEMFDVLLLNISDPYGLWDLKTMSLFVVPVNDAPVLAYGDNLFHSPFLNTQIHSDHLSPAFDAEKVIQCVENTLCFLEALHVRDVDASELVDNALSHVLTVSIMTSKGHIRIDADRNVLLYTFQRTSSQSISVDIGTESVSSVLNGLIYVPDQDTYGYARLFIEVSDNGNTGLCADSLGDYLPSSIFNILRSNPCPLKASLNMTMFIQPIHDRINISLIDGYFFTNEDSALAIRGIYFANHEHQSLQASVDILNYFPGVVDSDHHESLQLLYSTPNINNVSGKVFTVRLASTHGIFTLGTVPLNISFVYNYNDMYDAVFSNSMYVGNNNTAELVIMGNLIDLNLAMKFLIFMPDKHVNIYNRGLASINVRIYDDIMSVGNYTWQGASATKDIYVNIRPINDVPVVLLPGETYRVRDTDIVKIEKLASVEVVRISEDSTYSLNTLRLYDIDESDYKHNLYTLTLYALYGGFVGQTVQSQVRLQLYRDSHSLSSSSEVEFTGSVAELNILVDALAYRPIPNFYGFDNLHVRICESYLNDTMVNTNTLYSDDTSYINTLNPADRNVICSNRTLPISISSVNDAPSLVHSGSIVYEGGDTSMLCNANKAYYFGVGKQPDLVLVDVDSEGVMYWMSIRVRKGFLTLGNIRSDVVLLDGIGENDKSVVLAGSLLSLNQVLASLIYIPPPDYDSTKDGSGDALVVQVRDNLKLIGREISFLSDSLEAVLNIFIAISRGVSLAPTISLPGAERRLSPCVTSEGQAGELGDVEPHPMHEQCGHIIRVLNFNITEDTPTLIPNVSFSLPSEIDRYFYLKMFIVNLTTLQGVLSLPLDTRGVRLLRGVQNGVGVKVLSFVGTMGNINLLLSHLVYTPPMDYYGDDYLSVYVSDDVRSGGRQGSWSNETLPIQIFPVPDGPLIHVNISYPNPDVKALEVWEDMKLSIEGIFLSDPDYLEVVSTTPTFNRTEDERYGTGAYKRRGAGAAKGAGGEGGESRGQGSEGVMLQRVQEDKGLLRLDVEVIHGRIKFSSLKDLAILTLPSAVSETDRLSRYPLSKGSLEERSIYEGIGSYFDLETNTTLPYAGTASNTSFKVSSIRLIIFYMY